ncbi:hypothetical protein BCR33DRAFT_712380, partial [Rhizoclosmatium globosum]
MEEFHEEKAFVVEEVNNVIKESIETTIQNAAYHHNKVGQWNSNIVEQCLKRLAGLNKPFKYIGGFPWGLHAQLCKRTGRVFTLLLLVTGIVLRMVRCTTYKYDSKTMYCIVNVFGLA